MNNQNENSYERSGYRVSQQREGNSTSRSDELMQQNHPKYQKQERIERHAEIKEQNEQAEADRLAVIAAHKNLPV